MLLIEVVTYGKLSFIYLFVWWMKIDSTNSYRCIFFTAFLEMYYKIIYTSWLGWLSFKDNSLHIIGGFIIKLSRIWFLTVLKDYALKMLKDTYKKMLKEEY